LQEVAMQGSGDIKADLIHLVTEMLTFLHRNRDMIWLGLAEGEETHRLFVRLREAPERTLIAMTRFFEAAVAAGQLQDRDPRRMATALAGMLMAFALEVPAFGALPLQDPRQTARFIVDLFLNGVRKDAAETMEEA
jgi:AcrR family transcriptional regulator